MLNNGCRKRTKVLYNCINFIHETFNSLKNLSLLLGKTLFTVGILNKLIVIDVIDTFVQDKLLEKYYCFDCTVNM